MERKLVILNIILVLVILMTIIYNLLRAFRQQEVVPVQLEKRKTSQQNVSSEKDVIAEKKAKEREKVAELAIPEPEEIEGIPSEKEIGTETAYEVAEVSKTFKGIGSRPLFDLLIKPPPPKPVERSIFDLTVAWELKEIVTPEEVIIKDARGNLLTVRVGEEIDTARGEKVKLNKVDEENSKAELVYKNQSRWLSLIDIRIQTRKWRLVGVSPMTQECFILDRTGQTQVVREGETLDHVKVEKITDEGIILRYGGMRLSLQVGEEVS